MVTAGDDVLRVLIKWIRLTIKVVVFDGEPIVMAYCQHVNR